jgi:hypothetical protein
MTLPRSTRRSAANWVVNSATLAVLVSSVWMSSQQRPASVPQFSGAPATGAVARPVSGAGVTTTTHNVNVPTTVSLAGVPIDGEAIHRVVFSTGAKR